MKLIIGLGNPGSRYAGTRHNAGRLLIEEIARREGLSLARKKDLHASLAAVEWESGETIVAFPHAYMNLSGPVVKAFIRYFGINPAGDLLVVVDDFYLPFGRLRLRAKGSDGGHKGLKSVQESLHTQAYARLRIGIGMPSQGCDSVTGGEKAEDYVLSAFSSREKRELKNIFLRGTQACRLWVTQSIETAMNDVNQDLKAS